MTLYFSNLFKGIRKRLGFSQEELALILEISESEIYLIETCQLLPQHETIARLQSLENDHYGIITAMS